MRLFSNSCFGGWFYQLHNIPYSTPFVWAKVNIPDMIYLMNNMQTINFSRFTVEPNADWSLWKTVIDSQITLYWTHYKFSSIDSTPRIYPPADVYYCKIYEYIYQKYITRMRRMFEDASEPVFILDFTCQKYMPSENLLLQIPHNYKCVVIHPYDRLDQMKPRSSNILYLLAEWEVNKKLYLSNHIDEISRHLLQ